METCKLCLKEKELRNSHIIPEFMYTGIYDYNPKRFYEIQEKEGEEKSRIEQKGKREKLLCGECEVKFSKYEKYADENLYGKNNKGKAVLMNKSMTEDGKVVLNEFENFDYHNMKMFLDSLLWRLLVSKSYNTPEYDSDWLEKLRLSLYNESPLNPDEFPCLIHSIMKNGNEILGGFILSPIEKTRGKNIILSILVDGLEYNFYMPVCYSNDAINPFLQRNGNLKVLSSLLINIPELVEILKPKMNHLKDRLDD